MIEIIDKDTWSMSFKAIINKRNSKDIVSLLISDIELSRRRKKHGSNWILPENDGLSSGCIVKVFWYHWRTIIMNNNSFPMFFVRTHTSHIDRIVVMTQIFAWLSRPIDRRNAVFFIFLSLTQLLNNLRFGGR